MPRSLNVPLISSRPRLLRFAITCLFAASTALTALPAFSQDWGSDSSQADDDWSSADDRSYNNQTSAGAPSTPWSFRAGMGFTANPNHFLLSFELPYRFDQYVSVGPLIQVGLEDDRYLVAPSLNLTITIPNLPGESLDRWKPNLFAGVGFAVIENEDKFGDDREAAFLIDTGFGVDYILSERVTLGSRMIFNFLPDRALGEEFFYTWEVIGIKLAF